jgi:MraZ protein
VGRQPLAASPKSLWLRRISHFAALTSCARHSYSGAKWEKVGGNGLNARPGLVFRGATKLTLDDKGRLVIPTRYRDQIAERCQGHLVVTVDRDPCLLIYPLPDWEQIERKLMNLPTLHPQVRKLQRVMVGHATDLELDGHGRMLLPPELREFAGLGRHTMLIGQGNRFELWDEARWNERRDVWLKSEDGTGLPAELDSLSL